MSKHDVRVREPKVVSTLTFQVASGGTLAIEAGEPVVRTSGTKEVALMADAKPVVDTDEMVGIAATDSTETSGAAGTVDVYVFKGGEIIEAFAKTKASFDTTSEIEAIALDNKLFDLTSSAWTIDGTTATSALNGLVMVGGDPQQSRLFAAIKARATMIGSKL